MKVITKFWIGIVILIVLSPLGLLLPEHFKAVGAWGEWSVDKIRMLAGYAPSGLEKLSALWKAPMPGYTFGYAQQKDSPHFSFAYIISAILGSGLIVLIVLLLGRVLVKKDDKE